MNDLFVVVPFSYRPTLWQRLTYEPGAVVHHVHFCPECCRYEDCEQLCTLEPDLELLDGTPSGAHILCTRCRPPHEHRCPLCLQDATCTDGCIVEDLRVCEGCRPGVWPVPPEQLALPGVLLP